ASSRCSRSHNSGKSRAGATTSGYTSKWAYLPAFGRSWPVEKSATGAVTFWTCSKRWVSTPTKRGSNGVCVPSNPRMTKTLRRWCDFVDRADALHAVTYDAGRARESCPCPMDASQLDRGGETKRSDVVQTSRGPAFGPCGASCSARVSAASQDLGGQDDP